MALWARRLNGRVFHAVTQAQWHADKLQPRCSSLPLHWTRATWQAAPPPDAALCRQCAHLTDRCDATCSKCAPGRRATPRAYRQRGVRACAPR